MASRRVILGAGIGSLALIGVGGFWRVSKTPQTAHEPWAVSTEPLADIRLEAFRYAILAPNPHNRQPWQIRMIGDNQAAISCDLDKRLPVTDPFDRQITIGFGTFLEIARIAAAARGCRMDVESFPEGEPVDRLDDRPVALVTFNPDDGLAREPLFPYITRRRSNKEEYDLARTVPASLLQRVLAEGGEYTVEPKRIALLRDQIQAGIVTEFSKEDAHMESVNLIRIGHAEIDANPDGIDLDGPLAEAGSALGMLDRPQLADMSSSVYQTSVDQSRATYGSIPALFWIKTKTNDRVSQLEAGRQYVLANLKATATGLAIHPMSQTLQEYPEVSAHFAQVHQLLGATGDERVQMLARIGYGPATGPSPRWPLEKHIV